MSDHNHRYFPPKSSRSSLFARMCNRSSVSHDVTKQSNNKPFLRRLRNGEVKSAPSSQELLSIPQQCSATRNYIRAFRRTWTTVASTPYQSIRQSDITFESLQTIAHTTKRSKLHTTDQLKQACEDIPRGNTIWLDSNSTKLMQYLPNFIPENLALDLELELDRLVLAAPPKIPKSLARYDGFEQWRTDNLPSKDTPCGELRLPIYNQRGHSDDRPGPSADLAGQSSSPTSTMRPAKRPQDMRSEVTDSPR